MIDNDRVVFFQTTSSMRDAEPDSLAEKPVTPVDKPVTLANYVDAALQRLKV